MATYGSSTGADPQPDLEAAQIPRVASATATPHGPAEHKDSLNRYSSVPATLSQKDHFLDPDDGKLRALEVQLAPACLEKDCNCRQQQRLPNSWLRPSKSDGFRDLWKSYQELPRNILTWTFNDVVRNEAVMNGSLLRDPSMPDSDEAYFKMVFKYPFACLVLTVSALLGNIEGGLQPGGRYPPVRYKYFRYVKRTQYEPEQSELHTKDNHLGKSRATVAETESPAAEIQQRHEPEQSKQANQHEQPQGSEISRQPEEDEDPMRLSKAFLDADVMDGVLGRRLRPRNLCIVRDRPNADGSKYDICDVGRWDRDRPANESGEYVFVSYTRDQFQTYSAADVEKWKEAETDKEKAIRMIMPTIYKDDLNLLCDIGIEAANRAGVRAFWIDVLCMSADTMKLDSHRICDIARGSNRMAIAIHGNYEDRLIALQERQPEPEETDAALLTNWASRLWTLPEMLLAPTRHDFEVYRAGPVPRFVEAIPKRNMAEKAYEPEYNQLIRQLVDHFEASQQLTPTELLTVGLQCLFSRKMRPYMKADVIYALMTMARRRPVPVDGESLFAAFARLSLLNDTNSLLERLICLLPRHRDRPWHDMDDFWGAKLWDIVPTCQVAAVADDNDDQTVLLDGAVGASITWHEMKKVAVLKRRTPWRTVGSWMVRLAPGWLLLASILLGTMGESRVATVDPETGESKENPSPALIIAIILLVIGVISVLFLPGAMLAHVKGKFWSTQALLVGLEGHASLPWLELQLFGFQEGRLRWSPDGSTQSRNRLKEGGEGMWLEGGECEGVEPSRKIPEIGDPEKGDPEKGDPEKGDPEKGDPKKGDPKKVDPERLFTIVDTYSLTATLIRSVHPPSVALVCGHEGGMRRALLCSYHYKTQTFHRETVIRMPTKVLDRMDRVDKFRFSMKSMPLARQLG